MSAATNSTPISLATSHTLASFRQALHYAWTVAPLAQATAAAIGVITKSFSADLGRDFMASKSLSNSPDCALKSTAPFSSFHLY
jgi:hypothetical protein